MAYEIMSVSRADMQKQVNSATAAGFLHYVYGLMRGDTGELFYVGKGSNGRVFDHELPHNLSADGNRHKKGIIQKVGVGGYVFFGAFTDHGSACSAEVEVIARHGIERDGGTLVNDTLGGDGVDAETARRCATQAWSDADSGLRQFWASEEGRRLRGASAERAQYIRPTPEQSRTTAKKGWENEETRRKIEEGVRGYWESDVGVAEKALRRERMSKDNPMHKEANRAKARITSSAYANRPDVKEKSRRRMLKNPVARRPEVRAKMSEARRKRMGNLSAYCAEFGITSPGKNFCNVDKTHFEQWVKGRK